MTNANQLITYRDVGPIAFLCQVTHTTYTCTLMYIYIIIYIYNYIYTVYIIIIIYIIYIYPGNIVLQQPNIFMGVEEGGGGGMSWQFLAI